MKTPNLRAYAAPMYTDNANPAPMPNTSERQPHTDWRGLWSLEDGQPAWTGSAVSAMDGAIQGEMGHS